MPAWTKIYMLEDAPLEDPILVQGLPGLGFVGKIAVNYIVDELKLRRFAELYSIHLLLPDGSSGIQIRPDGTYFLPKFEFYAYNRSKPHVIFLTGDTQPGSYGQYEVAEYVLDFAQKYGCEKIISLGGFQTPIEKDMGKVYGVFNKTDMDKELRELGVNITRSGAITGACGVILGLGDQRKLDAIGLLGATSGEHPDMKAARGVIQVLTRVIGLELDLSRLDKEIKDMNLKLQALTHLQAEVSGQVKKDVGKPPFYV